MRTIIKEPKYQTRCPRCACHFEFEYKDITRKEDCSRDRYVGCPFCNNAIYTHQNGKEELRKNIKVIYKKENKQ